MDDLRLAARRERAIRNKLIDFGLITGKKYSPKTKGKSKGLV
jgi:hypothetical protein